MAQTSDDTPPPWHDRARTFFASQPAGVFTKKELAATLEAERALLHLPRSLRVDRFIAVLESERILLKLRLTHDPGGRTHTGKRRYPPLVRYVSPRATAYDVGLALRRQSYLSHASALAIHGLSNRRGNTLYLNKEQTPKPRPVTPLTQKGIDLAFSNAARTSRYVFAGMNARFVLLNGKHTGQAGVIQADGPNRAPVLVTSIERSLIDAAVRPVYAGGVRAVLAAYRAARGRVSVGAVVGLLRRLDHVYPYHQAIGFYMQRAGYDPSELTELRALAMVFDFYLANAMKNLAYDEQWRIFYPRSLLRSAPRDR